MKEIVDFLKANPVQYLGTVDLEGRPSVCPFQFMFDYDGKLWFYTSNSKDVYRHMKKNPNVELCVCNDKNKWVRVSGEAIFSANQEVKERMLDSCSKVNSMFKTVSNPEFEVFYIGNGKAIMYDHSQENPKEYSI